MSWWDTKGLTTFATQALKTAQKRIDKVLDIKEEEEQGLEQGGGSRTTVLSTTGLSETAELSYTENIPKPSEGDDSFFNTWLSSPSQQLDARRSPSGNTSPLASSHQSPIQTHSASLQESRSVTSTVSPGTTPSRDRASFSEQKLHRLTSSEQPAIDIKSYQKEAERSELLPISVSISDDRQATPENIRVTGLLISTSAGDTAKLSSCERIEIKFDENVPLDKGMISDVRKNDVPETGVALLVSSSNEDGIDRMRDDHTVSLSAMPKLDLSASSGHFNSHLSSSILAASPEELLGIDEDIQPEIGWNDVPDGDMWMSSTVDLPEVENEDIFMMSVRTKLADQLDYKDVDFQFGKASGVVGSVDKDGQNSDKDEMSAIIPQDVSNTLSAEVDGKVMKEVHSLEGSMKEISSLEGSLEASADELSESNKTVVAEDSDVHGDDTDVDEMQMSGSARSGIQQEHSVSVLSSELCTSSATGSETVLMEHGLSSGTDQLAECSTTHGDDGSEAGGTSPHSVKNLLEEAMADSSTRDSAGSEPARIESSGNSGHTSADEIDTTTSSDIEIISHASSVNGRAASTHGSRPVDISPSRHCNVWNSRTAYNMVSGQQHRRSDSGSSAQSLQSRTEDDFASPDTDHGRDHLSRQSRDSRRLYAKSDPECQNNPYDVEKLLKKLAELAEVLDAREKKLVEVSHENMDLIETNNDFRNRLQQMEQTCEMDMESVRQECSRRVSDLEKRLHVTVMEKDALKVTLHDAEMEVSRRSESVVTEKLLKEKEQIIAELMDEGEKLSKKQLQNSTTIKKLRAKEKETETQITSLKQKVDEQKADIERLEQILDGKVEAEKKNIDTINQFNVLVKGQDDEVNRLKSELEDAQEKYRSIKVTLDNAYREISDLHKARVTHVSEAQKAALDVEVAAKEQLREALDECKLQAKREKMMQLNQIEDLQMSVSRMEKEQGRREDILRQEISDLQQRLQEAEERNQELTQSVSNVTRPLLRQIENLQSTFAAQTSSYERVEKNLTDRLTEAQTQLASATEKERFASEKLMEVNARLSSLESQISSLRHERSRLLADLEVERTKYELVEEAKTTEMAQRDAAKQKLEMELNELKKEKVLLENQLEMENMKVETGKKKIALLHDQLHEKEVLLQMRPTASPSASARDDGTKSEVPGTPTSTASLNQSELSDKMLIMSAVNGSRMSLYDSLRQTNSAASLIESLQSELKQREGEAMQLQSEISELERTRESMARELVSVCIQNEDLTDKLSYHEALQQKYAGLDQRYNALLQMYGEKVEEAEELRLDLQDVKEMYKSQIDELLKSKSTPLRDL